MGLHDVGHGADNNGSIALASFLQVNPAEAATDETPGEALVARLSSADLVTERSKSSIGLETIDGSRGGQRSKLLRDPPLATITAGEDGVRVASRPAGDGLAATDGYVSFSESESDCTSSKVNIGGASSNLLSPGAQTMPPLQRKNNDDESEAEIGQRLHAHNEDSTDRQDGHERVVENGSDKWNFNDDGHERKQGAVRTKPTNRSVGTYSIVGSIEIMAPGSVAGGTLKASHDVLPELLDGVIVNRLGRRKNCPTR